MHEYKFLTLADAKIADAGPGRLSGYASVFDGVDSYGDTIVKGAYKNTISTFLKDGFIPWGHDWAGYPVATPDKAREDDTGLWIEAEFHTDAESQRVRALVAERLARGKSMGLSIGYQAKGFDFQEIDGHQVRRLLDIELMEVSLVLVPADAAARVAAVKGLKRALNRQQMDRIVAVILEALSADDIDADDGALPPDDGKAAESPSLDVLTAYVATVQQASDEEALAARDTIAALLTQTAKAGGVLEAALARIDAIGAEDPLALLRQFRRLEGIYAPIQSGQRAG